MPFTLEIINIREDHQPKDGLRPVVASLTSEQDMVPTKRQLMAEKLASAVHLVLAPARELDGLTTAVPLDYLKAQITTDGQTVPLPQTLYFNP